MSITTKGALGMATASREIAKGMGVTGVSGRALTFGTRKSDTLHNTICNLCTGRSVIRPSNAAKILCGRSDLVTRKIVKSSKALRFSRLCLKRVCLGRVAPPRKCALSAAGCRMSMACRNRSITRIAESLAMGRRMGGRTFRLVGVDRSKRRARASLITKTEFGMCLVDSLARIGGKGLGPSGKRDCATDSFGGCSFDGRRITIACRGKATMPMPRLVASAGKCTIDPRLPCKDCIMIRDAAPRGLGAVSPFIMGIRGSDERPVR